MRAVIFVISLMLVGCAEHGVRFDPNKVNELQPGVSTIQDAIQLLGPPSSTANMANGSKLLQWQFVYGTVVGGGGAHAAVLFGSDDKMIRVTQLTTVGREQSSGAVTQEAASGRPRLGIQASALTRQHASALNLTEARGVLVVTVNPSSVADRAGVARGDVILELNGTKIVDYASLMQAINAAPFGQPVPLIVWRAGRELPLSVTF